MFNPGIIQSQHSWDLDLDFINQVYYESGIRRNFADIITLNNTPVFNSDGWKLVDGDVATIDNLDTAEWYKGDEGAFLIEFSGWENQGTQSYILSNGSSARWLYMPGNFNYCVYDGENVLNSGVPESSNRTRVVVTWNANTVKILATGGVVQNGEYNGSFLGQSTLRLFEERNISVNLHQLKSVRRFLSDGEMQTLINESPQ